MVVWEASYSNDGRRRPPPSPHTTPHPNTASADRPFVWLTFSNVPSSPSPLLLHVRKARDEEGWCVHACLTFVAIPILLRGGGGSGWRGVVVEGRHVLATRGFCPNWHLNTRSPMRAHTSMHTRGTTLSTFTCYRCRNGGGAAGSCSNSWWAF